MNLSIVDFKKALFEKAIEKNFTDCEIYFSKSSDFEVKILDGEVSSYKNSETLGISFRGVFKGIMGYSFSEKISYDIIEFLLENAKNNAEVIEDSEKEELFCGDKDYEIVDGYNEELSQMTAYEKIDIAKKIEKETFSLDSRVKAVDYCVLGTGENEIFISNTLGLELSNKSNYLISYVVPRLVENEQTKVSMDFWVGKDYKNFDYKKMCKNAVEKAIVQFGASSTDSNKYNIVFKNEAFSSLLEAFIEIFFAENVQKGFSLLAGKLNTKIASDIFTIKDDALLENVLGSTPFDSEGVKTSNKVVVEKGILKTYLYNLKSAKKDGVKSTGNGFKSSFKSYVVTSGTNFYVKPSDISFDDMIKSVDSGILITDLEGLHAGINSISGDFSLSAKGFLIENQQITKPIEQITIAGNFFEMLCEIIAVSDDLVFGLPSSGGNVGSPSVYVGKLDVAGN